MIALNGKAAYPSAERIDGGVEAAEEELVGSAGELVGNLPHPHIQCGLKSMGGNERFACTLLA
eukprot:scaffold77434_cov35-Tisochrysis_lutea.AAC.2